MKSAYGEAYNNVVQRQDNEIETLEKQLRMERLFRQVFSIAAALEAAALVAIWLI